MALFMTIPVLKKSNNGHLMKVTGSLDLGRAGMHTKTTTENGSRERQEREYIKMSYDRDESGRWAIVEEPERESDEMPVYEIGITTTCTTYHRVDANYKDEAIRIATQLAVDERLESNLIADHEDYKVDYCEEA